VVDPADVAEPPVKAVQAVRGGRAATVGNSRSATSMGR